MRVRAIDAEGDWLFGKGQNDYKVNLDAVAQRIQTRLSSFLGNCFFATSDGIDWFNLLGSKNQLAINLAIKTTILNTPFVTGILELEVDLNRTTRRITCQYRAQTAYSELITDDFIYDIGTT